MNTHVRVFSEQQQAFIDWAVKGHGSCCLIAVAGAGKSTTVVEAAIQMPGQVALMAYNRSAGKELKDKIEKINEERTEKGLPIIDWRKLQAGTAHSFGFAAYRKAFPNVKVDGEKVSKMLDDIIERAKQNGDENKAELYHRHFSKIRQLVSHAKNSGLGALKSMENDTFWFEIIDKFDLMDEEEGAGIDAHWLIDAARKLLQASNKRTDWIDFDDQIYLPLLLKLRFWRFDNVIMDEAQDTNAIRRALMRAMLKPGGRAIAVGDPRQAIYGFTGADADSMDHIKRDFSAREMPLTVSYRCPKAVVAFSHAWVSHIQAHPDASAGRVSQMNEPDFYLSDLGGGQAVLCRLTKPLVQLAFSLIRRKVPCKVEGREIGEQIKKLANRWKVQNTEALNEKLSTYLENETTKLLAKKQETKAALVEDAVLTIKAIIDECNKQYKYSVADVTAFIDELFADNITGILTLSTIHKAKGREWEKVYWLNRSSTCPSPWARQAWQKEQEDNLCYVAATRAKSELIELTITEKKEQTSKQKEKQS